MTVALPGYVYFRYPAKLLVVTSLGLSMLAALGWDRMRASSNSLWWQFFASLAVFSGLACLALNLAWPSIFARLQTIAPDELFGPFDGAQARIEITQSLLHTAAISALLAAILRFVVRNNASSAFAPIACLILTAVDLVIAQRPLIQFAPVGAWSTKPPALETIAADARVYRDPRCWNDAWRHSGSPDRLLENLAWELATLLPKYNLPRRIALVDSKGTLSSHQMQIFWDVTRAHARSSERLPDASTLRLAAVSHLIAPDGPSRGGTPLANGASLFVLPNAPRVWIVHDVQVLGELNNTFPVRLRQRTEEVLFPEGHVRDWSREAVVETATALPAFSPPATHAPPESCQIVAESPQRLEIEARLTSPGIVVLADSFAPGWTLSVESDGIARDAEILRTNRVLRGVALPAGDHRLVYRYRPATFYWGAAISGVSFVVLLVIAAVAWRNKSPGTAGG
jgi:hypothetical protein